MACTDADASILRRHVARRLRVYSNGRQEDCFLDAFPITRRVGRNRCLVCKSRPSGQLMQDDETGIVCDLLFRTRCNFISLTYLERRCRKSSGLENTRSERTVGLLINTVAATPLMSLLMEILHSTSGRYLVPERAGLSF